MSGGGVSQQYLLALRSVSPTFTCLQGNAERLSWRSQALHVLDRVIRLDCKRAKPADRVMFEGAVRSVRSSVNEVMSDGSFRYAGPHR